jgi:hypothetical protein
MAHYSHSHTDRYERTERRHGHAGLILTGIALAMLAALAWVWTQGSGVDSTLPQTPAQPVAKVQAAAPAAAPVAVAAATVAPAPVIAAPVTAQAPSQMTAPQTAAPAATDQPAASAVLPPSDVVAAAGDTRAAR